MTRPRWPRHRPALTPRGRGMLSAGVSVLICGLVLGQRDLTRLAVLVVALPVVSLLTTAFRRVRVDVTRRTGTTAPAVDEAVTVQLALRGTRLSHLLLREELPPSMGPAPRFTLLSLAGDRPVTVTYTVTPTERGRFELGPTSVWVTEPLGLSTVRRRVGDPTPVLVRPRSFHLTPPGAGAAGGTGDDDAGAPAETGEDTLSVREYRPGDDLRRVHWRSTARHGELMVRSGEQHISRRATVLLDNRFDAFRAVRRTGEPSFEWAVSLAASVCRTLRADGHRVSLVTRDSAGVPTAAEEDHLDVLATLPLVRAGGPLARLTEVVPADHGPLVVIAGDLDRPDVASLESLPTGRRVLFTLGRPDGPGAGWTVVPVRDGMSAGEAWASGMAGEVVA